MAEDSPISFEKQKTDPQHCGPIPGIGEKVTVIDSQNRLYPKENLEESEPYLGIWWTVLMICLYLLKSFVDPEIYTFLWFAEMYVLVLVLFVTIFTIYKRIKYYRRQK